MNILMSGATGFVGTNLTRAFQGRGWEVLPLGRDDFKLDRDSFAEKCRGADVVINLAGAPIAERWTEEYKKVLYGSRIDTTRKIVEALSSMAEKPRLFISTSAVGIYDTKGVHTEDRATFARDFLGKLAQDWEREAMKAREAGVRTVIFRFGIVLGKGGGALQRMLIPFKLGAGGVIGDGKQPFSWVHIDDLIRAYFTVIEQESYEGVYNLTAPNPSTNKELSKTIGRVLKRPVLLRIPAFVLRLQFGEAAKVLLEGQTVLPERLLESGFTFTFPRIEQALEDILRR